MPLKATCCGLFSHTIFQSVFYCKKYVLWNAVFVPLPHVTLCYVMKQNDVTASYRRKWSLVSEYHLLHVVWTVVLTVDSKFISDHKRKRAASGDSLSLSWLIYAIVELTHGPSDDRQTDRQTDSIKDRLTEKSCQLSSLTASQP